MGAERYRHLCGSASTLTNHLIWCPKYRCQVLTRRVETRLRALIVSKAKELYCEIELEVMPDHMRLFLRAPPTHAPQHMASQLKGYMSYEPHELREKLPFLKSGMSSLWSRSSHIGSAGALSAAMSQKCVEQQKES